MKRWLRRIFKIVLSIVATLLVVAVGGYLLRDRLLARPLARLVAAEISGALGGTFRLDRVEGDWFTGVVLRGLATETPPAEGALRGIAFTRAGATYRLKELLFGDARNAIDRIEVEGLELTLDLTVPSADPEAPSPTAKEILDALPRPLPKILVAGSVTVRMVDGTLAAREVRLDGGGESLGLLLAGLALPDALGPPPAAFRASLSREGRYGLLATAEDGIAGVRLREARVDLDTGIAGALRLEMAGGTVNVEGTPERATFQLQRIDLSLLPEPLLRIASVEEGVAGLLDASGQIGSFDDPDIDATATLEGASYGEWRAERLHVDGAWAKGRGLLRRLDVATPRGTVSAHAVAVDPALPYLVGGIDDLAVAIPDAQAFLAGLPVRVELDLPAAPVSIDVKVARGADGVVRIHRAVAASGRSTVTIEGTALLQERPEAWRESAVDLSFDAELHEIDKALSGVLRARGSLSGALSAPQASLAIEGRDLVVEGRRVREVTLEGNLAGDRLRIGSLRLDAEPGSLTLSGDADLKERSLSDATFSFSIGDLAGFASMVPGAPALAGSASGEGSIVRGTLDGAWTGAVRFDASDLAVDGSLLGDATVRAEADGPRIALQQLSLKGPIVNAELAGTLTMEEGTFFPLRAEREGIELVCEAPLTVAWSEERVSFRGLVARVLGGRIEGEGSLGERIELHVSGEGLSRPEGTAAFRLDASGPRDAPEATLRLNLPRFAYEGIEGSAELTARQGPGGLAIESLSATSGARRVTGSAHLPFVAGLSGLRRIDGGVQRVSLVADAPDLGEAGQFGISGRDLSVRIDAEGERMNALVRFLDLSYRDPGGASVEIGGETRLEIVSGAQGTSLTATSGEGAPLFVRGALTSGATFAWTSPAEAWERLRKGGVAGSLTAHLPDLSAFAPLLPMFVRLGGEASVEIALGGSVAEPTWSGLLRVAAPALRLAGDLPSIQDLEARVALRGREARIESLTGMLGYESFHVEGGARLLPGGAPELDLRVAGRNLLLARTPTLRLRADLDVALRGPLDSLAATGTVAVTDALYSRAISLLSEGRAAADDKLQLFAIREGPFARLALSIDVSAEETIRIENNVAQGLLSAHLHLGGSGAVPIPEGRIDFRDLTVRIPVSGTRLKVERGQLSFPVEDPFTPRLMAGARTRMQGYELSVAASGSLPDLDVFVTSVPPLPTEDALVLLTTGTLPKDLERKGGSAALSMAGTYLGERLLERLSGPSDPDKESFFDRFSAEVGRDVSVTGQPTVGAEFRITERWYLAAGRDKYDDYNGGILLRLRFR